MTLAKLPLFHFQVNGDTQKEVESFMKAVSALDIDVEEWDYRFRDREDETVVHGFAMSPYLPKHLNRIADAMGLALIYTKLVTPEDYECFLIDQEAAQSEEIP